MSEMGLLQGLSTGLSKGLEGYVAERDRRDKRALAEQEQESKRQLLAQKIAEEQYGRQKDRAGLLRQGYKPLLTGQTPGKGVLTTTIGDETFGFDPAEEQAKKMEIAMAAARAGQDVKGTPGQQAADKAAGEDYQKYKFGGGEALAQENLNKITQASADVVDKSATGGFLGLLQKDPTGIGSAIASFAAPEKVKVKGDVDSVVFQSLKQTFGGNPTEGERKSITDVLFDTRLPPEMIQQRLIEFGTRLSQQKQAQDQQAAYFEKNGTLRGYKGPQPLTKADFMASVEALKNKNDVGSQSGGLIQEANAVGKSGLTPAQRAKRIQELRAKLNK